VDNINMQHDRVRISKIILYLFLGIITLVYLYPLVWVLINSFKNNTELFTKPWALPAKFMWGNYIYAWNTGRIGRYMLNSFIVTTVSIIFAVLLSSMAAYGIRRMKWKLSGFVLILFLAGTMIPIHAIIIPLFINFSKLHLTNSYLSLILPYITFAFPTTIYILSGFFGTIPREVEEAAVIDGCSMWKVYLKIVMPIAKPAIITVCIFNVVFMWNELLVALIFITDMNLMTLPVGLTAFSGQYSTNYPPLLAAIFMSILPSIIVYSIFTSQIAAGMTVGAVKG